MLKQEEVEREEERLRALARELSDEDRKAFFEAFSKRVKDPDTYAVLNWFFPLVFITSILGGGPGDWRILV